MYQPGNGWLFRTGIGVKYLILLGLTTPALILKTWPVTVVGIVLAALALVSSGIELAWLLRLGGAMWVILAMLAGYNLVTAGPAGAVIQSGNLLLAILASRILTLTTPTPELLHGLTRACTPLRCVGINPQRVALTISLMIRSIPYLLGLFGQAKDAAGARGVGRNVVALLFPVVLGAVAYADRTSDALAARGLGERPPDPAGRPASGEATG